MKRVLFEVNGLVHYITVARLGPWIIKSEVPLAIEMKKTGKVNGLIEMSVEILKLLRGRRSKL